MNKTNKEVEEKTYDLALSEEELAIIKAALIYYSQLNHLGHILWAIWGGSLGTSGYRPMVMANQLIEKLDHSHTVGPSFYWMEPSQLSQMIEGRLNYASKHEEDCLQKVFIETEEKNNKVGDK